MRVLGVLDLLNGRAVHARAGDRAHYRPVQVIAGARIEPGDAQAVARIYQDHYGLTELYAADLDAITGQPSQDRVVRDLAVLADLWLDAGVSSIAQARRALTLGIAHVIVGLETLRSWDALRDICAGLGGDRVAFSLDLRDGELLANGAIADGEPPHSVATRAARAGASAILVIDLQKVGARTGLDLELIDQVRNAVPDVTLLAGGGVRRFEDVCRLAEVGCDGVLVATAIHDGTLDAPDVMAARALGRRPQPRATR